MSSYLLKDKKGRVISRDPDLLVEVVISQLKEKDIEIKVLKALLNKAIKIARILSKTPAVCRDAHHGPREYHQYGDVCPVEERITKVTIDLFDLIKEATSTKKRHEPKP